MDRNSIIRLQKAVGAKVDGAMGEGTLTAVFAKIGANAADAAVLGRSANVYLNQFGILDSALVFAHFLAQAAHETGNFKSFTEYGNDAYFKKYDGRVDLGNTVAGDGLLYKGRGIFMLTGKSNYLLYSKRTGLDLMTEPMRAAKPDVSMITACHFWKNKGFTELALVDNIDRITYKLNGGYMGLAERKANLAKFKGWLLG